MWCKMKTNKLKNNKSGMIDPITIILILVVIVAGLAVIGIVDIPILANYWLFVAAAVALTGVLVTNFFGISIGIISALVVLFLLSVNYLKVLFP